MQVVVHDDNAPLVQGAGSEAEIGEGARVRVAAIHVYQHVGRIPRQPQQLLRRDGHGIRLEYPHLPQAYRLVVEGTRKVAAEGFHVPSPRAVNIERLAIEHVNGHHR